MDEEKNEIQIMDTASETNDVSPVSEKSAPKQRRKRRTKAEIEADAKKAAAKAKREARKAAKAVIEEGTQVAEKISQPRIPAPEIVVQYSGNEISSASLTTAAVEQFRSVKKRAKISEIKLYVKPEEHTAYYVINGDFSGKIDF